jgi:type II secretory ATPase GspE/PulE/Tfp pilus assembly ATPase PilB-like protein
LNEDLEKAILTRASASEIQKLAKNGGMTTIVQDGILKAAMGETTIEEALKLS